MQLNWIDSGVSSPSHSSQSYAHHQGLVIRSALDGARSALDALCSDAAALGAAERAAGALVACLRAGNKILVCGNGGSLCDAAHFAEELTGRFRHDRPPLPAIAITDPGHLTCTANDYGFEHVFSRAVEALGRPGDTLIAISTSGNSPNVLRAVRAAEGRGVATIGLLGRGGGELKGACTYEVIVPGATSDRIQELHMLILHAWVEAIETSLFGTG